MVQWFDSYANLDDHSQVRDDRVTMQTFLDIMGYTVDDWVQNANAQNPW